MYKNRIAVQVAAYFLWKAKEPLELPKLLKLMYFAEREYLFARESRLTGDELVSTCHGPALSHSLEIYFVLPYNEYWSQWLASESNNRIALRNPNCVRDSFDLLNDVILEILNQVFEKYGKYESKALIELSRDPAICPEWKKPEGSLKPIKLEDLYRSNGYSEEKVQGIMEAIKEQDDYDNLIADLTY